MDTPRGPITVRQMMIGVYKHLRQARYLGSMTIQQYIIQKETYTPTIYTNPIPTKTQSQKNNNIQQLYIYMHSFSENLSSAGKRGQFF